MPWTVQTWFSGKMQVFPGFPSFQRMQVVTGQWTVNTRESQSVNDTSVRTISIILTKPHFAIVYVNVKIFKEEYNYLVQTGCWIRAIHVDKTRANLATVMTDICGGKTNRLCVSLYTQVSNRRRRQPMAMRVESRDCGREGISNRGIWYDVLDLLTLLQPFVSDVFGSVEWVHE